MKQLAAARAVITIWTPNSIRSDWVRAEAGRAKAEGKLIPVKTSDVAYADIPLPFGEMHTENVTSTDLIRAAIVAQLARPTVPQSQFWQITSTFKYQILAWIGVVGTSITLFANLNSVLNLADWARELVRHWQDWNHLIWQFAFAWTGVKLEREVVLIISFTVFVTVLAIATNRSSANATRSGIIRKPTQVFLAGVILYLAMFRLFILVGHLVSDATETDLAYSVWYNVVLMILMILFPLGYLLYCCKERVWVFIAALLFLIMTEILLLGPFDRIIAISGQMLRPSARIAILVVYLSFPIYWMAVVLFCPLRPLTRRLGFAVLGVLTLVVLSEISKLNASISTTAKGVREFGEVESLRKF
jgi:hypothetical protein